MTTRHLVMDRDQLLLLIGALAALKADWTNLPTLDEHIKADALTNIEILTDLLVDELKRLDNVTEG